MDLAEIADSTVEWLERNRMLVGFVSGVALTVFVHSCASAQEHEEITYRIDCPNGKVVMMRTNNMDILLAHILVAQKDITPELYSKIVLGLFPENEEAVKKFLAFCIGVQSS